MNLAIRISTWSSAATLTPRREKTLLASAQGAKCEHWLQPGTCCEPVIITPSGNDVDYRTNDLNLGITKQSSKSLSLKILPPQWSLCGAFSQAAGASTRANKHRKEATPTLATIYAEFAARYAQAQCLPCGESSPPRLVTAHMHGGSSSLVLLGYS